MSSKPRYVVFDRMYGWYATHRRKGKRIAEAGFEAKDAPVKIVTGIGEAWDRAMKMHRRRGPELVHVVATPALYLDLRGTDRAKPPAALPPDVDGVVYGYSRHEPPSHVDYFNWKVLKPSPIRIVD